MKNPLIQGFVIQAPTLADYLPGRFRNLRGSGWASITPAGRAALARIKCDRSPPRPLRSLPCPDPDATGGK